MKKMLLVLLCQSLLRADFDGISIDKGEPVILLTEKLYKGNTFPMISTFTGANSIVRILSVENFAGILHINIINTNNNTIEHLVIHNLN